MIKRKKRKTSLWHGQKKNLNMKIFLLNGQRLMMPGDLIQRTGYI